MGASNIYNRIIKRGGQSDQSRFEKRRLVFFNIAVLFIIFSSLAMVFIAHKPTSKYLNIAGFLIYLGIYYLHKWKPGLSVLLMGIFFQAFIFLHSSILDIGGHVEYAILAMTAIVPVFYRGWLAYYFLFSNLLIFYYPYLVENAYESFFKLSYAYAVGSFFIIQAFRNENEKYEKILIEKQKELRELNNEKNHLIQVVAHDLRSPLNQIEGWVNIINLSKISEEVAAYLTRIIDSVHSMDNMIMRTLDVEKIERRESPKLKSIDLTPILTSVVDQFKILALNKNIALNLINQDGPIIVKGNAHYLEQAFRNLLSNAIKFSPKDKEIKIAVSEADKEVHIKFIDEGPGISAIDQEKLFMKFQRLSAEPTNNESSTGLGLSIAKSFVEAMSGSILCDSQLGSGATFIIQLPLALA